MSVISKKIKFAGSKGEEHLETLFDSGASYSFIKKEIAEKLGIIDALRNPKSFETAEHDRFIKVESVVRLDFYIDNIELSDEFLVTNNMSEAVIIGASTMQKWRMRLDFENDEIIVDKKVSRLILKRNK